MPYLSHAKYACMLFLDFLISSIDSQSIPVKYYNKMNLALQNVLIFSLSKDLLAFQIPLNIIFHLN